MLVHTVSVIRRNRAPGSNDNCGGGKPVNVGRRHYARVEPTSEPRDNQPGKPSLAQLMVIGVVYRFMACFDWPTT